MLILTRRPGESLYFGDPKAPEKAVKITLLSVQGHQVRLGIGAPPQTAIHREEIWNRVLQEQKKEEDSGTQAAGG